MPPPRKPLVAGNWKLFRTVAEARALAGALRTRLAAIHGVELVICPPFTALSAVNAELENSNLGLGGQDLFWEKSGPYTGEISATLLRDVGCRYAIVGHSERRQILGETDAQVGKKTAAALAAGLSPIVCVGETQAERDADETFEVVSRQVEAAIRGLPTEWVERLTLAYEPVWAIGTGRNATPAQAEEVHVRLRALVGGLHGAPVAGALRIVYGGSVLPANCAGIFAEPNVDGALLGGASLSVDSFAAIVQAAEALGWHSPSGSAK